MRERPLAVDLIAALVLGIAQTYLLMYVWGYLAVNSPLLEWVLDAGLRGVSLKAVVYPIDFLTNVVLSLPLAFVLVRLRPGNPLLLLLVAVVPSFIWHNFHLLSSGALEQFWASFVFGWVLELLALPVATLLLHFVSRPSAPNNALQATCEDARA